jgi:hypothetical protein
MCICWFLCKYKTERCILYVTERKIKRVFTNHFGSPSTFQNTFISPLTINRIFHGSVFENSASVGRDAVSLVVHLPAFGRDVAPLASSSFFDVKSLTVNALWFFETSDTDYTFIRRRIPECPHHSSWSCFKIHVKRCGLSAASRVMLMSHACYWKCFVKALTCFSVQGTASCERHCLLWANNVLVYKSQASASASICTA